MNLFKTEPAVVTGVVSAVLALLVAFNVPLSEDQGQAILGATVAILALVQGLVVRSQVAPVAKVDEDDYEAEHSTGL